MNIRYFEDGTQQVPNRVADAPLQLLINILCLVGVINRENCRWAGHVARMGKERGVYRVLVGKPEAKRPLGRPRRRWVDNIRMDLEE